MLLEESQSYIKRWQKERTCNKHSIFSIVFIIVAILKLFQISRVMLQVKAIVRKNEAIMSKHLHVERSFQPTMMIIFLYNTIFSSCSRSTEFEWLCTFTRYDDLKQSKCTKTNFKYIWPMVLMIYEYKRSQMLPTSKMKTCFLMRFPPLYCWDDACRCIASDVFVDMIVLQIRAREKGQTSNSL